MNATVWFGSSVFFTLVAAPAIFSDDMKAAFGVQNARSADYFTGAIAQIMIARYFLLHHVCGAVALVHLLAEWLYLGKTLEKLTFGVVIGVFSLGLLGGFWLQPKLKDLRQTKYLVKANSPQWEKADKSFKAWHGVSQVLNLGVLLGLALYCWRMANPSDAPRFFSTTKFQ